MAILTTGAGLQIRVRNQKISFIISQPKYMLWVLKKPSHWDGSFEHPKQMLKLKKRNYLQFYAENDCLSGPMSDVTVDTNGWHQAPIE